MSTTDQARKDYVAPRVEDLGSLTELTANLISGTKNDNSGLPTANKS